MVDYITRATRKADDLLSANGITSWILWQSQIHRRQKRTIAKHHDDDWIKLVSNWKPAFSSKQNRYNKQGRWLTTTEDNSEWDAMESDFIGNRLKQPARPPSPRLRQSNQQRTTKQQVRLRLQTKTKTARSDDYEKTTIRHSPSFN